MVLCYPPSICGCKCSPPTHPSRRRRRHPPAIENKRKPRRLHLAGGKGGKPAAPSAVPGVAVRFPLGEPAAQPCPCQEWALGLALAEALGALERALRRARAVSRLVGFCHPRSPNSFLLYLCLKHTGEAASEGRNLLPSDKTGREGTDLGARGETERRRRGRGSAPRTAPRRGRAGSERGAPRGDSGGPSPGGHGLTAERRKFGSRVAGAGVKADLGRSKQINARWW